MVPSLPLARWNDFPRTIVSVFGKKKDKWINAGFIFGIASYGLKHS
jgi:hypothetical protein